MKTALAFSGGKDSWACLWLNEDRLSEILVIWANTGKNYPEALEMIEKARAICPNFLEVVVDRDEQNRRNGIPSDVVPIGWTHKGMAVTGLKPVMIQSYLDCCFSNISEAINSAAKGRGITRIIKGQRNDEKYRSPSQDGTEYDGITYEQPLDDWTREQVMEYLAGKMEIPPHFALNHSSLDCYDCTAFRSESKDRVAWMAEKHPVLFEQYKCRSDAVLSAIMEALN